MNSSTAVFWCPRNRLPTIASVAGRRIRPKPSCAKLRSETAFSIFFPSTWLPLPSEHRTGAPFRKMLAQGCRVAMSHRTTRTGHTHLIQRMSGAAHCARYVAGARPTLPQRINPTAAFVTHLMRIKPHFSIEAALVWEWLVRKGMPPDLFRGFPHIAAFATDYRTSSTPAASSNNAKGALAGAFRRTGRICFADQLIR